MDWSHWSGGQIAVLAAGATIAAAIVGGSAALMTALVNAWSTRRLAREAALREERLRALRVMLETTTKRREIFKMRPDELTNDFLIGMYIDESADSRVALAMLSKPVREGVGALLGGEIAYLLAAGKGADDAHEKEREMKRSAEALGRAIERDIFLM